MVTLTLSALRLWYLITLFAENQYSVITQGALVGFQQQPDEQHQCRTNKSIHSCIEFTLVVAPRLPNIESTQIE